ncbi:MAG: prolyl-tRNA synthetase associated domain-containing protein [Bacteroidaceae bacterium]|nr:prolyl-tRNA synthetase associated domain-containing protein [Bacteroidaceae bacterium]
MIGQQIVYDKLKELDIPFVYTEHPAAPTIEIGREYWADLPGTHCKNLFFRNHKGNRHYLVIFQCDQNLAIHDLEHLLHQGKLSFASEQRMEKYLGLRPGSVSPFGLLNDEEHHVYVFLDENLRNYSHLSFHPNDNHASLNITIDDFIRYMDSTGNQYEWIKLY